jgi:hypothetical protein
MFEAWVVERRRDFDARALSVRHFDTLDLSEPTFTLDEWDSRGLPRVN